MLSKVRLGSSERFFAHDDSVILHSEMVSQQHPVLNDVKYYGIEHRRILETGGGFVTTAKLRRAWVRGDLSNQHLAIFFFFLLGVSHIFLIALCRSSIRRTTGTNG